MTISLNEAKLVGSLDQHEQITVENETGAALVKNEVFSKLNASGTRIPHVAQGDIADGATGEACVVGEFDFAKADGNAFDADDDIYWHVSANEAVTRDNAKAGDFYLARCTLAAASGDEWVRGRLGVGIGGADNSLSESSSISVSVSASSESSSSTSDSSVSSSSDSKTSKSISSDSTSSSSRLSISSLSNSSSSSLISISSNSDSSSSTSVQ